MSKPFDPYHVWLGIPPEHRPPTYYQLLGIAPDEQDREVIQAAVLRLSAYVRNFQVGKHADHADCILTELVEAKACLLDAASRARYDAALAPAPTASPARVTRADRPRAAPAAAPPTIEMGELVVEAYDAPAPRAAVSLPPPRRRIGHVAPKTPALAWLLPLAVGLLVTLVVVAIALRPRGSDVPLTLDGQFVATAPTNPLPQQTAVLPPANQSNVNPPAMTPLAPPAVVEQSPAQEAARPEPSFGSESSPAPPASVPSPPPTDVESGSSPVANREAVKAAAPPVATFAPPVARQSAPVGASLTSARKQVDGAFSKEFRSAKTAAQRLAAVHQLYYESQKAEKMALRYAYLEECRDRAVNMSEAGLAFEALEEMGRLFDADAGPLKVEALKVSLEKSRQPEQVYTIAMLALAARNRASSTNPALAEQFGSLASAAERKITSSALGLAASSRTDIRRNRGVGGLPSLGVPRPGLATTIFAGSDFEQELLRRVDRHIDFHFGFGPADAALPADRFSIRWTGWLTPPLSGKYVITASARGGVRVTIGDQMVIDSWQAVFGAGEPNKEIELTSRPYVIVVEYSERVVPGSISLRWAIKDRSTEHTIPAEVFSHEPMIGE